MALKWSGWSYLNSYLTTQKLLDLLIVALYLVMQAAISLKIFKFTRTHRDNKRVQSVAHLIRCVELSIHHSMGSSLSQVPHPELCSLKVRRVDHKLLEEKQKSVQVRRN